MRKRWQVLSAIASFGVMGFGGAIARFGSFPINATFLCGLGGFVIACGIALWAAITDYRQRWPAAVALVAIAPFAQHLYEVLIGRAMIGRLDLLSLEVVGSSVGTVGAAIVILMMRVPPPDDPLPMARI